MEQKTLNQAMRGDYSGTIATFESAVDTGWRIYLFIEHDPRWQELLQQPAANSLVTFVKADLERQRKMIEAINEKDNFRAVFEQQKSLD